MYFNSNQLTVQLFKMFAFLIFVFTVSTPTYAENIASSPRDQEANYCLLPPFPEHGRYIVSNHHSATPWEKYYSVKLDISCDAGYINNNTFKSIYCVNGYWSASMQKCVRDLLGFCSLSIDDLKVEYRCKAAPASPKSSQECESFVPLGTVVTPICRSPAYFSLRKLSKMHCRNGTWDYNPICKPACGLTTEHLQLEGTSSNHLELPWHVVIYRKWFKFYYQNCGGSLLTATKIISAAYCFSVEDELLPAGDFIAAVNKMYRSYYIPRDRNSQYSDVDQIIIPSSYRGSATYYEDNIAIVVVKKPFFFHLSVRPVCLDFDNNLDRTQLTKGNSGIMASWSVHDTYRSSRVLNVRDFNYMKNEDCDIKLLWTNFRQCLTKNKFCMTYNNETSRLFKTDTGSGLAFLESTTQRYYLRGVYSESLSPDGITNIVTYTSIVKHEHFIKQHL